VRRRTSERRMAHLRADGRAGRADAGHLPLQRLVPLFGNRRRFCPEWHPTCFG